MYHVKGFDTLRALAVFSVIICHWGTFLKPGSTADTFIINTMPGPFGLIVFFVLSGYLITSILLKERYKHFNEGASRSTIIKSFFVRRTLRIFPIYYITLAVLYAINHPYVRDHIWWYVTYLGNLRPFIENGPNPIIHMWSLAVEEQFYLLWPWLILFMPEKWMKHMFVAALTIGIVSKYIVLFVMHNDFPTLVINCFDGFGIGGLYAYVRMDPKRKENFEGKFRHIIVLMLFVWWLLTPYKGIPQVQMYSRVLELVMALSIIMFTLNNKYEFVRKYMLETKVLTYLGKVSYGIYIFHYMIHTYCFEFLEMLARKFPSMPAVLHCHAVKWFFSLGCLFGLAALSYTFIEQPILKLKSKFKYS